ncbi:MAG: hypothetical protein EOO23_05420 [Comamonadaceae bacterium]|nr:MAG: hypothetical protein EOO23_05420 [Comamonadaceae bacterium]
MTPQTAKLMADYNRWMNERMYASASTLSAQALTADKGAFFGSILASLNHIAVSDTLWLHRFATHPARFPALEAMAGFGLPTSLRQPLAPDLAGLGLLREQLDALIQQWAQEQMRAYFATKAGSVGRTAVTVTSSQRSSQCGPPMQKLCLGYSIGFTAARKSPEPILDSHPREPLARL